MGITFKEITEELDEAVMEQNPAKAKCAELIARAFAARNAAHFAHLITPSYAQHVALNTFYDELIPLVDAVAESFMGRYGKFEAFPNVREAATDGLTIVGNLTKWIDANREMVAETSEIQNDIDTIISLCNSTAYKLRELK
jgi:Family of unknown function (DUF5856)